MCAEEVLSSEEELGVPDDIFFFTWFMFISEPVNKINYTTFFGLIHLHTLKKQYIYGYIAYLHGNMVILK